MRLTETKDNAIEYAEKYDLLLCKYADPIEDARDDLTPDEAREIAREDAGLIYIDVDPATPTGAKAYRHIDKWVMESHWRGTVYDDGGYDYYIVPINWQGTALEGVDWIREQAANLGIPEQGYVDARGFVYGKGGK